MRPSDLARPAGPRNPRRAWPGSPRRTIRCSRPRTASTVSTGMKRPALDVVEDHPRVAHDQLRQLLLLEQMAGEGMSVAEHQHRVQAGGLERRGVGRRQVQARAPAIDEHLVRWADLLPGALERRGWIDVADVAGAHRVVDRVGDRHRAVGAALIALDRRVACPLAEHVAGVADQVLDRAGARGHEGRQGLPDRVEPPFVAREQAQRALGLEHPRVVEQARRDRRGDRLIELRERVRIEGPADAVPGNRQRLAPGDRGQGGAQRRGDLAEVRGAEGELELQAVRRVRRGVGDRDAAQWGDAVVREGVVHRGVELDRRGEIALLHGEVARFLQTWLSAERP